MRSIDEILWPKGSSDVEDAEQYAKEWWIKFHANELDTSLEGQYRPTSLDLKRAAKADARRVKRKT